MYPPFSEPKNGSNLGLHSDVTSKRKVHDSEWKEFHLPSFLPSMSVTQKR